MHTCDWVWSSSSLTFHIIQIGGNNRQKQNRRTSKYSYRCNLLFCQIHQGVSECLITSLLAFGSAPLSRSSWTTSRWPLSAERMRTSTPVYTGQIKDERPGETTTYRKDKQTELKEHNYTYRLDNFRQQHLKTQALIFTKLWNSHNLFDAYPVPSIRICASIQEQPNHDQMIRTEIIKREYDVERSGSILWEKDTL